MLGKGEKRLVAAYSAAHFAVDLCCAMLVLPAARAASDKAMALLIYNFCAFAMQLPIGVLADRYGGGRYFSAIGCLMVALGGLLPSPMLTAVVCGLGNAAFHIGGGADVMAVTEGAKYLGIYVSPGAMGIFPGALGLLLFNMSMPVTLYAARDILREGRATAFGLLTLGLFLGMLPAFSGASGSGQDYAMICLISIMLIRVGVGKR